MQTLEGLGGWREGVDCLLVSFSSLPAESEEKRRGDYIMSHRDKQAHLHSPGSGSEDENSKKRDE